MGTLLNIKEGEQVFLLSSSQAITYQGEFYPKDPLFFDLIIKKHHATHAEYGVFSYPAIHDFSWMLGADIALFHLSHDHHIRPLMSGFIHEIKSENGIYHIHFTSFKKLLNNIV